MRIFVSLQKNYFPSETVHRICWGTLNIDLTHYIYIVWKVEVQANTEKESVFGLFYILLFV